MNDVTNAPLCPGSGAGTGDGSSSSGAGGGAVRIEAAGTVTINGTINVNGTHGTVVQSGGGSGGSIYINCMKFGGGVNGLLTAAGGSCTAASPLSGGGGGGRIAVWIGVSNSRMEDYLAGQSSSSITVSSDYSKFLGSTSKANGTGWKNPPDAAAAAPGSLVFLVSKGLGTFISFR